MTDKTDALPEALELADRLTGNAEIDECEGCNPTVVALERSAAAELRRQHAEIQHLKAQLSARQAVPDGWRLAPFKPTPEMINAGVAARRSGGTSDEVYMAMLSAAPPPPEREPLTEEQIDAIGDATGKPSKNWHYEFAHAIERAHGIGASNETN